MMLQQGGKRNLFDKIAYFSIIMLTFATNLAKE